ncbi:Methyltranfer_dom domain-containing protein [Caenorhabditis elegans]|uniref:Methyltranfer_dom domain-containing protein n=1 Tax=Caenorhabditis elegans TaxID=6239 RepID=Q7YX18_CAEEL|nr:Methyltranfer_dom domain-containing protein [Caenorhabditis elegans]CAE17820.4 Methyltranfer_dom domain-containing protein [Caenorhabditis elegans]|eukprot:NP_001021486.2 Uncharacterized protein CELE_F52F12.9 [Caenorhabditis elegans]
MMKFKRSKLYSMIKKIAIFSGIFFVIQATSNFCLQEKELTDEEFYDAVLMKHFENKNNKVIAAECPDPKDNSTCLYIIDRIGYFKDGTWFVARFLTPAPHLMKGFLSISRLAKPVFKTNRTANTAEWPVDVGYMDPLTPNAVEFTTLFSTGHFPLNHDITRDVTFLGVATGGLMSFMAEYFKNMKLTGVDIDPQSEYLAKKWFGYQNRKNDRIFIADGAEFIKQMAENGETSDAVLVDACHNTEPVDDIYCPVAPIRTPEFLDNLSKVIGTKGMTTFNVYIQKATIDNYERMRDDFSKHFHDCKLINSKHLLANMFLVCSNKGIYDNGVDVNKTKKFLRNMKIEQFLRNVI